MSNSFHHELLPILRKHKASRVFTDWELLDLAGYEANREQCHRPNTFAKPSEAKTDEQVAGEQRLLKTLRATEQNQLAADYQKDRRLVAVERLRARHPEEVKAILEAIPKAIEQRSETSKIIRGNLHAIAEQYQLAGLAKTVEWLFEELHGRPPSEGDRSELHRIEVALLDVWQRGPLNPFATQRRKKPPQKQLKNGAH